MKLHILPAACCLLALPVHAQEVTVEAAQSSTEAAQDVAPEVEIVTNTLPIVEPENDAEWMAWVPDASSVEMPDLAFEEEQGDIDNYKKYYYFFRADTDFETALGDLRECDAHARGLFRGNNYADPSAAMAQYGVLAGAAGGMIAGLMMDAIVGSGHQRNMRRVNMRRCMFYKEYGRFGLTKTLWKDFNFEEGNSTVREADRQRMLVRQALVAANSEPQQLELGL